MSEVRRSPNPQHPTLLEYVIRDLGDDEVEIVKVTLMSALDWRHDRPLPYSREQILAHPQVVRFYAGWGRVGDLGVVAESNGEVAGAALCRLFTEEDHGEGYLDPSTPPDEESRRTGLVWGGIGEG